MWECELWGFEVLHEDFNDDDDDDGDGSTGLKEDVEVEVEDVWE